MTRVGRYPAQELDGKVAGFTFERRAEFAITGDAQRDAAHAPPRADERAHAFFGSEPSDVQRVTTAALPEAGIVGQGIATHDQPLFGDAVRDEALPREFGQHDVAIDLCLVGTARAMQSAAEDHARGRDA